MNGEDMLGQWVGVADGTNKGFATLNLEQDRPLCGRLMFADFNQSLPSTIFRAKVELKGDYVHGVISDALAFDCTGSSPVQPDKRSVVFPSLTAFASDGSFEGKVDNATFQGKWNTNAGTNGTFHLKKSEANLPAHPGEQLSWDDFALLKSSLT